MHTVGTEPASWTGLDKRLLSVSFQTTIAFRELITGLPDSLSNHL